MRFFYTSQLPYTRIWNSEAADSDTQDSGFEDRAHNSPDLEQALPREPFTLDRWTSTQTKQNIPTTLDRLPIWLVSLLVRKLTFG